MRTLRNLLRMNRNEPIPFNDHYVSPASQLLGSFDSERISIGNAIERATTDPTGDAVRTVLTDLVRNKEYGASRLMATPALVELARVVTLQPAINKRLSQTMDVPAGWPKVALDFADAFKFIRFNPNTDCGYEADAGFTISGDQFKPTRHGNGYVLGTAEVVECHQHTAERVKQENKLANLLQDWRDPEAPARRAAEAAEAEAAAVREHERKRQALAKFHGCDPDDLELLGFWVKPENA